MLPHAVSIAVECPEEPFDHDLKPGDVEVLFHERGPYDSTGIDLLIEVRSKWFASRAENRDERCKRVRDAVRDAIGAVAVGIYLSLPVAGSAQTDDVLDP